MSRPNPLKTFDAIATRAVGIVLMAAAGTEAVDPALLAIDLKDAAFLGTCGFFLGTGRASAIVGALKRLLSPGDVDNE